jgi:hypothetical protein
MTVDIAQDSRYYYVTSIPTHVCLKTKEVIMNNLIKELDQLNRQIASLRLMKEEIEKEIVSQIDHPKEGQRSYEFGEYKLVIKKSLSLSLDRKAYQSSLIDSENDPVRLTQTYSINVPRYRELRDAGMDFGFITENDPITKVTIEVNS